MAKKKAEPTPVPVEPPVDDPDPGDVGTDPDPEPVEELELDDEESAAIVEKALAEAKAAKNAAARAAAAAEAQEAEDAPKRNPDTHIVIDVSGSQMVVAVRDAVDVKANPSHKHLRQWEYDRTVQLNGVTYEHVADDEHGRWVYRHLG